MTTGRNDYAAPRLWRVAERARPEGVGREARPGEPRALSHARRRRAVCSASQEATPARGAAGLPASGFEQLLGGELGGGDADHGLPEPSGDARQDLGVAEVRGGLDDRLRAERRVA